MILAYLIAFCLVINCLYIKTMAKVNITFVAGVIKTDNIVLKAIKFNKNDKNRKIDLLK